MGLDIGQGQTQVGMNKHAGRTAWWPRLALRLASTALGAWLLRRTAHHADRLLLKVSGGRHTLTTLLTGLPVVTLTTTGARSGKRRTVPVVGIPRGKEVALIASNFGHSRHPAWYHNLQAHGQVTLTINGQTERYLARNARGAERREVWQQAVTLYAGYEAYRKRAAERKIPVIILAPHRTSQEEDSGVHPPAGRAGKTTSEVM